MPPIESSLQQALEAATEAHNSGYVHGLGPVISGIQEVLDALDDVWYGDMDFTDIPELAYTEEI